MQNSYTRFEKLVRIIMYAMLVLIFIFCAYPFWYVLIYALSDSKAALDSPVILLPVEPTFKLFTQLLRLEMLWSSFLNSVLVTLAGAFLGIALTVTIAYPLSVKRLHFRKTVTMFLYFTMLFNGGMIPNYLLIRDIGLIDSRWSLILPGILSVYNLLVLRNFFMGLPEELEESASLDGATPMRILLRIILPISLPAIAVQAMLYGVSFWNSYMGSVMYINSPSKIELQAYLRSLLNSQTAASANVVSDSISSGYMSDASMRMGCVAISMIPVLLVYPKLQKYYIGGLTVGAVKG